MLFMKRSNFLGSFPGCLLITSKTTGRLKLGRISLNNNTVSIVAQMFISNISAGIYLFIIN